jgi:stringent starvation protein B
VSDSQPSSTKPYLIRAIHEWCTDNGLTPYLAVSVTQGVRVPMEHVRNGEIVLNVSMLATDKLQLQNDAVSFQGRFSGRVHQVYVPIENVAAIYAKETGSGMAFEAPKPMGEPELAQVHSLEPEPPEAPPPPSSPGRPKLTRVK